MLFIFQYPTVIEIGGAQDLIREAHAEASSECYSEKVSL